MSVIERTTGEVCEIKWIAVGCCRYVHIIICRSAILMRQSNGGVVGRRVYRHLCMCVCRPCTAEVWQFSLPPQGGDGLAHIRRLWEISTETENRVDISTPLAIPLCLDVSGGLTLVAAI